MATQAASQMRQSELSWDPPPEALSDFSHFLLVGKPNICSIGCATKHCRAARPIRTAASIHKRGRKFNELQHAGVMIHIEANVERLSQIALREEECGPTSQAKANRKAASQGKDRWSPPVAQGVAERESAQHRQRA